MGYLALLHRFTTCFLPITISHRMVVKIGIEPELVFFKVTCRCSVLEELENSIQNINSNNKNNVKELGVQYNRVLMN